MQEFAVITHIQELCNARGWTYYRLAKESGITYSTLSTMLNKENGGGFTGTYLGMYASSHRHSTTSYTDFQWFEYLPILT